MNNRLLFPRLLIVSAALFVTGSALAQSGESDFRPTNTLRSNSETRLETEPTASLPTEESRPRLVNPVIAPKPAPLAPAIAVTAAFDRQLLSAIQLHLGASYHFNRTGPDSFDCSGLVWRAFQDAGVDFQRGPARSYWAMFQAPPKEEEFRFGTLVFFNNLAHVGIVVDGKGFYHSARHGGVMYSPFNDYWLSRIDGFRRVPIEALRTTTASQPRASKPVTASNSVEER